MRDLTLSQEYLLCAVNEKGRLPHLGVERTVCLVAAALLELQLEGCVAVDKKYVTVTGPLPEGQAHLRPLYAFVNRPKPIRKEKLLEEYTYTVTDAQRDELLESIGRSLADLGLVQPVKVGLLGKKQGYAPTPEAISGVVDMIRAELLEEGEITEDVVSLVVLMEKGNCLKPYFSAFEQKQMKQRLRALGESPTGKMVQEMVEYVENMMAIAVGLIAVYSYGRTGGAMSRQRKLEVIQQAEDVTIGELVRLTDVRYSTLKFYTEQGMLPFQQAEENLTRRYKREESIRRIQWIKALRQEGKSIQQIKQMLHAQG